MNYKHEVMVHGHRGWRAKFPENSIVGFIEATRLGADALELDVVVDANHQLIVSHDPFMHHEICVKPDGTAISPEEETLLNIYHMQNEDRLLFSNPPPPHPRFPDQNREIASPKPTLYQVVLAVNKFVDSIHSNVPLWNIEIKSQPDWDNLFHPKPAAYARFFLDEIRKLDLEKKCVVQCFDARVLNELNQIAPQLKLVYLSDDADMNIANKLSLLDFKPYGYSPNYKMVSNELVEYCRTEKIELLVWTVNDELDMRAMIDMGVTHIITDYPDRLMKLVGRKN